MPQIYNINIVCIRPELVWLTNCHASGSSQLHHSSRHYHMSPVFQSLQLQVTIILNSAVPHYQPVFKPHTHTSQSFAKPSFANLSVLSIVLLLTVLTSFVILTTDLFFDPFGFVLLYLLAPWSLFVSWPSFLSLPYILIASLYPYLFDPPCLLKCIDL